MGGILDLVDEFGGNDASYKRKGFFRDFSLWIGISSPGFGRSMGAVE